MYQSGIKAPSGDLFQGNVTEFTSWLKMEEDFDTEIISRSLLSAVDIAEKYLWFDINKKDVIQYCVPVDSKIAIERNRLDALEDITLSYYNAAGTLTVMSTDDYRFEKGYMPYIKIINMPSYQDRQDAFVLEYATGFDNYSDVPNDIIALIFKIGAYNYENRNNEKQADLSWVERYALTIRDFRF
jgi:hypothetical protein